MKKMKKRSRQMLFLVPLSLLSISLLLGDTGANFYSSDQKEYLGKVGDLQVNLKDNDSITANLKVNNEQKRVISVKNDTEVNQFVRVMVFPVSKDTEDVATQSLPSEVAKNLNTSDWTEGKDGYFYYHKKLAKGQETSELFKQITSETPGEMTIYLKAEAISAEGDTFISAWWQKTIPTIDPLKTIYNTLESQVD
ncbi:hypothetical protein [Enterococcus termitis]|uniref:DUF4352 domain-containing protein n=1 Tax=Enterococcus termitis TaxID=332950 RepID=A0A1E5GAU8_9ENTE|nr:hypothetical protein [Enterococcus termitis]OEG09846.1 hypothetical protein BCR25_10100 [Enterococcus termitis]OJG98352.1 hypothetical protein RV18_GL003253 [Enterococcus termitis]